MKKLLSLPPNLVGWFHDITGYPKSEWFCTNDPIDHKLGSGGGTTWLLTQAYENEMAHSDANNQKTFDEWLSSEKRLLLHAGVKPDRPGAPGCILDSVRLWSSLGSEPFDNRSGSIKWQLSEIIPVSALFLHKIESLDGMQMTANFYKCGDLLTKPHFLSWSPIDLEKPMFHCPEFFGRILFER